MKQVGYIIRLDDKPMSENQILTHHYLTPNLINSYFPDRPESIRMGWPTYEEAKEAWKIHYNKGLECGVDHKELHKVTIVRLTIEEEELEEL